jgi:branched-chain amino acid transport system ATP-binding protein
MLSVKNLVAGYGGIEALHKLVIGVPKGRIVTLIGGNGAGKTTTLKTISALIKPRSGRINFDGRSLAGLRAHEIVRAGLCHVPEGRMIFANLTVRENLQMGAYLQRDKKDIQRQLDYVHAVFPLLRERSSQSAGTLSGGEQQMLAISRALMGKPRLLMLDEPSLGIAPLLVKTIFQKIVEINRDQGLTILLVEQNANLALEISHYGYVIETGKVILEGPSSDLRHNPQVREAYLGG